MLFIRLLAEKHCISAELMENQDVLFALRKRIK
jgi:hypothetical protein